MRLHIRQDLLQVLHVGRAIAPRKGDLVGGQLVAARGGDEPLGVHHVDGLVRLLLGDAIRLDEAGDHGRHPGGRAARAVEHHAHILHVGALRLHAVDKAAEHHGAGALDVVVEAEHAVPHALQNVEGRLRLEVLKLDEAVGPARGNGVAQLLHHRQLLLTSDARLLLPHVELVRQQLRPVGAAVKSDWQRVLRRKAAPRHIERNLADGDAHAVGAQVAEAQDAAAVRDDDDAHVG
mmetsp:Transcript_13271/g.34393  ORF Transcript_13271/g.34393 Transcript_13271/m.34393 type:complete len:235 (+) Transcript_13271:673-1377(+)